jgi:hypothetical protein
MMQKVNVCQGKTKMGKRARRELPCVRRLRSLLRERVVRGTVPMSIEREKSVEEEKKMQNNKIDGKSESCSHCGV